MKKLLTFVILLLFFCLVTSTLRGQNRLHAVYGKIMDIDTGDPLPFANVRLLGTTSGTVSNEDGYYTIVLFPGKHTLVFSYIGYNSRTFPVNITDSDIEIDIKLEPATATLSEILVTGDKYNAAERIILRAIEKKHETLDLLKNYDFKAYSKAVFSEIKKNKVGVLDTTIINILETQSTGYKTNPGKYKEIIDQRKQSANVDPTENLAVFGDVLQFNDDILKVGQNSAIGPTNPKALDYYYYDMVDTTAIDNIMVFNIKMTPKKGNVPLFDGIISIADSTFAVMHVDVGINDAFVLPFVKDIRYSTSFALYEGKFWMPVSEYVSLGIELNFPFTPDFTAYKTSIIHSYNINTNRNDDIFDDNFIINVREGANEIDSVKWVSTQSLPLTAEESVAYQRIDSIEANPSIFKKPFRAIAKLTDKIPDLNYTGFSDFFRFNRVEGAYLGGGFYFDNKVTNTDLLFKGGHGFSDKKWKYEVGIEQFLTQKRKFSFGGNISRQLSTISPTEIIGRGDNTFSSIMEKDDFYDYFLSEGGSIFGKWHFRANSFLSLGFRNEQEESQKRNTDYSLFSTDNVYRFNPPIVDGSSRSLKLSLHLDTQKYIGGGLNNVPLSRENSWIGYFEIETSDPDIIKSDFDYTKYALSVKRKQRMKGTNYTLYALEVGLSDGFVPPQQMYSLVSPVGTSSPFGTFKTIEAKEFSGDGLVAFHIEHHFGSYLFKTFKVPFLKYLPYDFMVSFSSGWTDISDKSESIQLYPLNVTNKPFYEAGVGLGKIFGFLRLSGTWSMNKRNNKSFAFNVNFSSN